MDNFLLAARQAMLRSAAGELLCMTIGRLQRIIRQICSTWNTNANSRSRFDAPWQYLWRSARRLQSFEQHLVETLRRLDLWCVSQIGKFDQPSVRNLCRSRLAKHGIIAQRGPHFRRRQVLAERRRVLVANKDRKSTRLNS